MSTQYEWKRSIHKIYFGWKKQSEQQMKWFTMHKICWWKFAGILFICRIVWNGKVWHSHEARWNQQFSICTKSVVSNDFLSVVWPFAVIVVTHGIHLICAYEKVQWLTDSSLLLHSKMHRENCKNITCTALEHCEIELNTVSAFNFLLLREL